jgi:tRNA threonylcarbamoyladenosine biosynthesis protein TsaB
LSLILHIETATKVCSVCLSKNGRLIHVIEESSEKYIHAEKLTLLIERLMDEANFNLKELEVISINKGPGSYTGLRIGVSTAKGLCYALGIPLIATDSLVALYFGFKEIMGPISENELIIPMIDARRMEVYTAAFNNNGEFYYKTNAKVIDQQFFNSLKEFKKLHVFGDGATKLKDKFDHQNIEIYDSIFCSSKFLIPLAFKNFVNKEFVNVAYFEPYYLKDFKPN